MKKETTYADVLKARGVNRRDFMKFCSLMSVYLGYSSTLIPKFVHAMETKPRIPVIWLHGLECTCCTESFIRSSHPIAADIILNMISLDYDETLSAAAGHQLEAVRKQIMKEYKGKYILAVEGNVPTKDDGVYCMINGESFGNILKETAVDAMAVIAWGSCASFGCVQNAKPNPTGATPVHKIIKDKPVVNVPGCPPIAEVMTGVIAHLLTFGELPELDRLKRPKAFYGTRIHDKCYRRPFFDAGMFVESFDDEGANKGWCLYKMGCKGPTTFNSCPTVKWNEGTSYPIQAGHPCLGCSEPGFWDNGPFYTRLADVPFLGTNSNADKIGMVAVGAAAAGMAAHAIGTAIQKNNEKAETTEGEG
ncbi:MAG: hydrogenase small subunit [Candidatus Marinimicrobia bacterium]|nr:uptake hydrogenase small subunit [Candidatus Neomarinimicrobiota bacterium]MDP6033213.1 hydrogenase small subunit [Candidatus Neomarinimicrobiota bacterium]MDP7216731.1 hydrogenase small subunit [Candidatus Neomarinimicrobiota bacterium]HJL75619.1 hydrogenase small subunit [Candidatus Neomarinimicrobiota bacterium]